jgi:hypothetical protein
MQKTAIEWVQLFQKGDPTLLQLITDNNPEQVATNLRANGLPIDSNPIGLYKEIINICKNCTKNQFFDILNVRFIAERNPDFLEVMQIANNNSISNTNNSYLFGETFSEGIENLRKNICNNTINKEEEKDKTEDLTLINFIEEQRENNRLNRKRTISLLLLTFTLVLFLFVFNRLKK